MLRFPRSAANTQVVAEFSRSPSSFFFSPPVLFSPPAQSSPQGC